MSLPAPDPGQFCYDYPIAPQIVIFVDTKLVLSLVALVLVLAFLRVLVRKV